MVFKTDKRKVYSKVIIGLSISIVFALFLQGIVPFEKNYIAASGIFLAFCGIMICCLFEETHIGKDYFAIHCFYYKKKINVQSIKRVILTKSKIYLYSDEHKLLHSFLRDGSEKLEIIMDLLMNHQIPISECGLKNLFKK